MSNLSNVFGDPGKGGLSPGPLRHEGPRRRILLVCPRVVATFTRQDLRILQSEFDASLFPFEGVASLPGLRREINSSDAVVLWFAGRHAGPAVWLARQQSIPVITIVGGYEAVWIPEIRYGIRPHSLREWVLRWILRKSARVVVVSQDTRRGVARVAPEVMGKTTCIYNAVDTSRFQPPHSEKRAGVLSVGMINEASLSRKGWSLYWRVAERMPSIPFVAVGTAADKEAAALVSHCPPNLRWLGGKTGEDLVSHFQMASIYFQGSVYESFSLSLAESMSCGCLPVVSRNGALPEVAGDVGYYLDDLSVESAVKAINEALNAPQERRLAARQRIVEHFDYERRREALCNLVREVIASPRP